MIITSLLDTDLYKFTMMQAVLHQFPSAQVEYKFKCRTPNINLAQYAEEIRAEIKQLCQLRFTEVELDYLRKLRFIKGDFVDFLAIFQLNEKYIKVTSLPNNEIDISIIGPWVHTILFEVPVLAIVNEVYFRNTQANPDYPQGLERLQQKIQLLQGVGQDAATRGKLQNLTIADYGTRRRFSVAWHRQLLQYLIDNLGTDTKKGGQLAGTSNVLLAKEFNLIPLGTMAHEYLQAFQALGPTRLRDSQKYAFESWASEYRGDLGIALSDVYGINAFLRDFDLYFCKLFDGARHDSGDPIRWGEKMIQHYHHYRIDPKSKTLIFSDGLTVPKVLQIYQHFYGRCNLAFGIGTNLTNDLGYQPLQIVIKMIRCNGEAVAKISDSPGKGMCEDEKYLSYLRQVFDVAEQDIYRQ